MLNAKGIDLDKDELGRVCWTEVAACLSWNALFHRRSYGPAVRQRSELWLQLPSAAARRYALREASSNLLRKR